MSIITSSYRTYNAKNFIDDMISNTSQNEYYVFGGDINISPIINSEFVKRDFLENILFGKKIKPENVFFLINNNRWSSGTVFDQYDDKEDLSIKNFYCVVYPFDNTTGDYRVFKCLFNNYGAPSTAAPNYIEGEQIYRTSDGYVWLHMYVMTQIEFEKYRVLSYLPIIGTNNGETPIDKSSISNVLIENPDTNRGYQYRTGKIVSVSDIDITISSPNDNLSKIPDFYAGQSLYVISIDNASVIPLFTIDKYTYIESDAEAIITIKGNSLPLRHPDSPIKENYRVAIFPRVEITGDGDGAIAIPNFPAGAEKDEEDGVNNRIISIEMLAYGSGYTNATARIINPSTGFDTLAVNSLDSEAILRPVLSPKGGHGSNFSEELTSNRVLVYNTFTNTENNSIPSSNVYTKVGIVKNPSFDGIPPDIFDNRLYLSLNSSGLEENESVTQSSISGITSFTAQVHATDSEGAYLCNYHGPYKNYPIETDTEKGYSDIPINLKSPIVSSQGQVLNINKNETLSNYVIERLPNIYTFAPGEHIVIRPPYVQKTGEVYYLTNFSPITRTSSSNEEYKIVLEF